MAILIDLDAGHGQGSAHNRGYKGAKWKNEGDGNFYFSLILKRELEKRGFQVRQTRTSIGQNPSLSARGASAKGCDLFVSLHTNAGGANATGVEIYEDVNSRATPLAKSLCNTIAGTLGIANRGVKYRYSSANSNYYGVLRANQAKAGMLIEHAFHDNYSDVGKYEAKAEELASNMANTFASYYGLNQIASKPLPPARNPEFLEGDVDVKAKETYVIACDRDKMNLIGELVKTGYDRSNGAYSNVVVLQNKKSSVSQYANCPYRIAVCNTADEISVYCNYAIIGTEEEIKKGIIEFANGANKKFEASNFRK